MHASSKISLTPYLSEISRVYVHDSDLELEAKFGYYKGRSFESNVPYVHFERLLSFLRTQVGNETIELSTVEIDDNNIRRITITPVGNDPEIEIWQRKYQAMDHIDLREYDIRISVNREEKLTARPANFTPTTTRERIRHSFVPTGFPISIDMTEIMTTTGEKSNQKYEVEMEFTGTLDQFNIFEHQLNRLFKFLRGTHLIFSTKDKNQLINDVNGILGGTKRYSIDKGVLAEARNIKMRDLVYGGIVGNPVTNYAVTFKADGLRKMLIIHSTGIWLVYPPFEFNLVMDLSLNLPGLDKVLKTLNGTIFDGEWVQPKSGIDKKTLYWFLVFDCLAYQGNPDIQNFPYPARKERVDAVVAIVKTPVLTLETKETKIINSPDEFFSTVGDFLTRRCTLEYEEDGLMFFPANYQYNPRTKDTINKVTRKPFRLHERSLTVIPDICKWKEKDNMTIDFSIRHHADGTIRLYSFDTSKEKLVEFQGSPFNPLTPDMVDSSNDLTRDIPSGTIVEYEWVENEGKGQLRPRRLRLDKSGPNRLDIALDDWADIMNPITSDDLRGATIKMTRSYFNRIKTELYDLIMAQYPNGANILDIGSGRGGDVSKWKILSGKNRSPSTGFVVAVEPNEENRTELYSRLASNRMENKVYVVDAPGQDTATITQAVASNIGKVDAITLMLSMSFFWESDSNLDALVATIVSNLKSGGMIVFLTIDGDVVEQIFEPALGGPIITDKRIVTANLHLYPRSTPPNGRALDFVLPDTIVGEQREYLVHLHDLSLRLEKYGIKLEMARRAEDEKLLTEENKLYSSMFTYGYYRHDKVTPLPSSSDMKISGPLLSSSSTISSTGSIGRTLTLPPIGSISSPSSSSNIPPIRPPIGPISSPSFSSSSNRPSILPPIPSPSSSSNIPPIQPPIGPIRPPIPSPSPSSSNRPSILPPIPSPSSSSNIPPVQPPIGPIRPPIPSPSPSSSGRPSILPPIPSPSPSSSSSGRPSILPPIPSPSSSSSGRPSILPPIPSVRLSSGTSLTPGNRPLTSPFTRKS